MVLRAGRDGRRKEAPQVSPRHCRTARDPAVPEIDRAPHPEAAFPAARQGNRAGLQGTFALRSAHADIHMYVGAFEADIAFSRPFYFICKTDLRFQSSAVLALQEASEGTSPT